MTIAVAFLLATAPAALAGPGDELWFSRYEEPERDHADDLVISPDGSRAFVTGRSDGGLNGDDYATVAYDTDTGAELWSKRYKGPKGPDTFGHDRAGAVAVGPDGEQVFVTGWSEKKTGRRDWDYATVAYDAATGDRLWARRYGPGKGDDFARAVGVSLDGNLVFVTGASSHDYATVAYDAATGRKLWVQRYRGLARGWGGSGRALEVSPDSSRVFVTGSARGDYVTIAYDSSSGARRWVKRYRGPAEGGGANDIGLSPNGRRVLVTGGVDGGEGSLDGDYATVAYRASSGRKLWASRYDSPVNQSTALALGVSPDGSRVFVTGGTGWATVFEDLATVAYDLRSGEELWVVRQEVPGNDHARDLAVSPDSSSVYVAGTDSQGESPDLAVVSYDAITGAEQWRGLYDGPANAADGALGVAVSPDGSQVLATGPSYGVADNGDDYATVAFRASAVGP